MLRPCDSRRTLLASPDSAAVRCPLRLSRTRTLRKHPLYASCSDTSSNSDGPSEQRIDRRKAGLLATVPALSFGLVRWAQARAPRTGLTLTSAEVQQLGEKDWQQRLTAGQYRVLRKQGTELPYSSGLVREKRDGTYRCAGCGNELFTSSAKYASGTGWPSFYDAITNSVKLSPDDSIPFFPRTEVSCTRCRGHIGHVFADGPQPTGLRYCMNGAALIFQPGKSDSALSA